MDAAGISDLIRRTPFIENIQATFATSGDGSEINFNLQFSNIVIWKRGRTLTRRSRWRRCQLYANQ